ncbi:MAG: endolytic transglycosylase MltG [Candidatus Accumulibacter sp.]|nr:endolytic transglycosylase MltG [Accumulibacter sp.]
MIRWLMKALRAGLIGLFAVLTAVLAAGGWFYWKVSSPLRLAGERVEFQVAPGSGMRAAARDVAAAGIDFDPWMLVALGKALRVEGSIKAGSYEIDRGINLLDLLHTLTRGDVALSEIRFIEGWTFRQLRARLDAHPDLRHDSKGMSEPEIMRRLGEEGAGEAGSSPEGWFFPDTYLFAKRGSDIDVLARSHRAMRRHLRREWERRAERLPLSDPYQALILASIVEKETGREADRPLIAAVFLNRLGKGMILQSDPTVIYGLGESFDGNLRKRDLSAETPYNTYVRNGLPPTPIAMPGLASLKAVLHPVPSRMLYFVARGDGSSHFSSTLDEHNRAVNRYQRGAR